MGGALVLIPAGLAAQCETLSGEVARGRGWERAFGEDLVFHLAPAVHSPPNPGTRAAGLVRGDAPSPLAFRPEGWAGIELSGLD